MKRKPPSLVDLCIHSAVKNKMDLSPITDNLWQKFYKDSFGKESFDSVVERMRELKVDFNWKQIYEAKQQESAEAIQKALDRLKQRKLEAERMRGQVQVCSDHHPISRNKRSFWGGKGKIASNINNTKSRIMKKSKLDFINCREVKNLAAMRKSKLAAMRKASKNHCVLPKPKPPITSQSTLSSSSSSSSSNRMSKPFLRRF